MATVEIQCDRLTHPTGDIGLLTLQRGQALNALTYGMIQTLDKQLTDWQSDDSVKAVVIQSADNKAFCAGGDIRQLYHHSLTQDPRVFAFFAREYALNYRIAHYPKPYIALLDGITMGGGVGISLHSPWAVATENVRIAMPETQIGFFPDIGGSYLLAKAPGALGAYLALTGTRLSLADGIYAGLIRHCLTADQLPSLLDALRQSPATQIEQVLTTYHQSPTTTSPLAAQQAVLDECFNQPTMSAIYQHLEAQTSPWAQDTLASLQKKSPTSLVITLAQMQRVKSQTLAQCLASDYRLVHRFLAAHDFFEGVRALLINKCGKPDWQPRDLAAVDAGIINHYFAPLAQELILD
jgi:enoyl-CoA hydratase/carnithine racemase